MARHYAAPQIDELFTENSVNTTLSLVYS